MWIRSRANLIQIEYYTMYLDTIITWHFNSSYPSGETLWNRRQWTNQHTKICRSGHQVGGRQIPDKSSQTSTDISRDTTESLFFVANKLSENESKLRPYAHFICVTFFHANTDPFLQHSLLMFSLSSIYLPDGWFFVFCFHQCPLSCVASSWASVG